MNLNEIDCFDLDGDSIDFLTQWDTNQTLYIEDWVYDETPIFHFCNSKSKQSLVVKGETIGTRAKANIPNILLQESHPVIAYLYLENDEVGQTIHYTRIPVRRKPKPHDYEYTENIEYISWIKLEAEARAFIEEISNDSDKFKKDYADAYNSFTSELNETTENFKQEYEQTLGSAKDNADKAAASAIEAKASEDKAKISADSAKDSENNAKTSEANAKSSEDKAKNSEINAKGSEDAANAYASNALDYSASAKESAELAARSATVASNYANDAKNSADSIDEKLNAKGDNLYFDYNTNLLYLTSNEKIVSDGIKIATEISVIDDDNGNVTFIFG